MRPPDRRWSTFLALLLILPCAAPCSSAEQGPGSSAAPQGAPLLQNGDFSRWESDVPVGWHCYPAIERGPYDRSKANCVRRGDDDSVVFEGGFGMGQEFQVESERTYRVRITARVTGERHQDQPAVLVLILGERSASLVISSTEYETHDVAQLSDYEGNPKGCAQLFEYNPGGGLQVKSVVLEKIPTDFSNCLALIDADLRQNYPFTDSTRTVWDQAIAKSAPLAAKARSELALRVIVFDALKTLRDPTLELEWPLLEDKWDSAITYYPPGISDRQLMDYAVASKHWLALPCGFQVRYRAKQN